MKSKTFVTEKGRLISIEVDEYISFKFPNEWNREFYWIDKDDWKNDHNHWTLHMVNKRWYTESMTKFINDAVK